MVTIILHVEEKVEDRYLITYDSCGVATPREVQLSEEILAEITKWVHANVEVFQQSEPVPLTIIPLPHANSTTTPFN